MISRRALMRNATILAVQWPFFGVAKGGATSADADAVQLLKRMRQGKVTASQAVEDALDRLGRVNPLLNAVTSATAVSARARAARPVAGAAFGVPIVTKDNTPRAGELFTQGSRAYRERIAAQTAPYLDAVDAAGFISIARSTCPEFGLAPTTEPQLTGPTRNPWDPSRSVGGSSGGSAALVAARAVHLAHGNDGGGSLRIPASACGVIGLKPSRRPEGPEGGTARSRAASGCLSRTVRDTVLWLSMVNGIAGLGRAPSKPLTIAACLTPPGGGLVDREVERVFAEMIRQLERLGHRVRAVALPYDGRPFVEAFLTLYERNAMQIVDRFERDFGHAATPRDLEPLTLGLAEAGRRSTAAQVQAAETAVANQAGRYVRGFDDYDLFLSPVLATPPVALGTFAPVIDYSQQREPLIDYATYTFIQNAANAPAISLPVGQSSAGLPIGMQLASAPRSEAVLIDVSSALEQRFQWNRRCPPICAA